MGKFIILSLPRSRSAWLSHFLAKNGPVGHDIALDCVSMEDFFSRFAKLEGSCETGAVLGWRVLKKNLPHCKIVIVWRNLQEIKQSLARFGIIPAEGDLEIKAEMLGAVASLNNTMNVNFWQLTDREILKKLYFHCLEEECTQEWLDKYENVNIQLDMQRHFGKLWHAEVRMKKLKLDVAIESAKIAGTSSCLELH